MSDEFVSIPLPTDADGFVSLDCPFCGLRFKLGASEVSEAPEAELYCPYCGIPTSPSLCTTQEIVDAAMRQAENILRNKINSFTKDIERTFRGSKNLKFKRGQPLRRLPDKPLLEDESLELSEMSCCKRRVKTIHPRTAAPMYCPYCGVNQ